MLRVLKDIYTHPALGPNLGFKGGTAAYLHYNLPRFSVDLDFDLLDPTKEDFIFNLMQKILAPYGTLTEATNKHYTLFYLLSYKSGLQKLKVEISKRPTPSQYETKQFLGLPMLVMTEADMFAHKLVALTDRRQLANRDIFDIYYFFKQNWAINTTIVEKSTSMAYQDYLQKCIRTIEKITPKSMLANMGELVDNKTKFWIKNHLKKEVLFLLTSNSQTG
jgi:predicted nucleotidyltransferase component of viral defense system